MDRAARWLRGQGFAALEIVPLAGDVSPRRYARVELAAGGTAILASYPAEPAEARAVCPRFLSTSELLAGAGVRVPRILAADCERGLMLVEDVGLRTLAELGAPGAQGRLPWSELAVWFERAVAAAARIAALPAASVAGLNPVLGRELLERELAQTRDVYLAPHGLLGEAPFAASVERLFAELCARLAADPPVPCHRDYMARNLVPVLAPIRAPERAEPERAEIAPAGAGELVVLDHQDLRLGPPAYDLASLLNDTLFPPPEAEETLLGLAAESPSQALQGVARLHYHRAAAQRTLKAVGTYAAFARRGVERHLPLIPPTLERAVRHLAQTPEGAALAPELARRWLAS